MNPLYARYIAASTASLGLDFGVFMASLAIGIPSAASAACGYVAGIVCHWLLSSRAVFVGRMADVGSGRQRQQALFIASALVGLAITSSIVGAGTAFGMDPRIAKGIAIVVSFQATYLLRRKVVFS